VATLAGEIVRLDLRDGHIQWRIGIGGEIHGSPIPLTVDLDGRHLLGLACASTNGQVVLLRSEDGSPIWRKAVGSAVVGSPGLGHGAVYVATGGRKLIALRLTDGESLWEQPIGPSQTSPVVSDDAIFLGCWDGSFAAYEPAIGKPIWTRRFGGSRYFAPASSTPLLSGDLLVVTCPITPKGSDPSVFRLDPATGGDVWTARLDAGYCSPAGDGARVILVLPEGQVTALSAARGKELWRTPTYSAVGRQHPTVVDGHVYIASLAGKLSCLDAVTGKLLWQVLVGGADSYILTSPALGGDCAVTAGIDGTVSCIDTTNAARTGAVQDLPGRAE